MEYCSVCRVARNMRVSFHKKKELDYSNGKEKDIIIKISHCENCGSFVRSEIVDGSSILSKLSGIDIDDSLLKK